MNDKPSSLYLVDSGYYYSKDLDACIFVEDGAGEVYAYYHNNDTWLELEDGPSDIDLENGAFYYDSESNRGMFIGWGDSGSRSDVFAHFEKFPEWSYETDVHIESRAISRNGENIVIVTGSDKTIYLFGKDSSTPLWSKTVSDTVRYVAISDDGDYIAVCGNSYLYLFEKHQASRIFP